MRFRYEITTKNSGLMPGKAKRPGANDVRLKEISDR